MKNLLKFGSIVSSAVLFPMIAFAQDAAGPCDALAGIGKAICQINQVLKAVLPVLVALGVIYFVWGIVQYFIADSEEARKTGKDRIIYGIIGLAVIVSIWGLVNLVVATFNIGGAVAPTGINVNGASSTCTLGASPKFQNLLGYATCIINSSVIPLFFAVAVVMFAWGVVKFFIINADEEAKREQGKQFMIWGIVALTAMLCIWGLVAILGGTFGLNTSVLPQVCPPGASCP